MVAAIVGGWRISGIQTYASGLPMNIGTNAVSFPIGEFTNRPTITTYQGWTLPYSGRFDPFQDSYLQPQSFLPGAVVNLVRQFHPVQPGLPQLASIQRGYRVIADLQH